MPVTDKLRPLGLSGAISLTPSRRASPPSPCDRILTDTRERPVIDRTNVTGSCDFALPRWYAASRVAYLRADYLGDLQQIEAVLGYHPAARQTIKLSYETNHSSNGEPPNRIVAIQFVTALPGLALARQ